MTSAESQTMLCRLATVLPSSRASLTDPVVRGEEATGATPPAVAQARGMAAASLPGAVAYTPALVTWPDLRRAFEDGIKRALLDGADVRKTLGEIQAQWNRILRAGPQERIESVPRPGRLEPGTGDGGAR
jgi:cation diffusion facilitator CzcD-associated flavoprotein CzcO